MARFNTTAGLRLSAAMVTTGRPLANSAEMAAAGLHLGRFPSLLTPLKQAFKQADIMCETGHVVDSVSSEDRWRKFSTPSTLPAKRD